jgi:hypothetical protein
MKKNNIIIFATYWNEIDWIKASLKQIEKLNPVEIIICDGCFDDTRNNMSTDGTREIIKEWVSKRGNATMISATRVSRFSGLIKILKAHDKIKWYYVFTPARFKSLYLTLVSNKYRINQALTFQRMISISKYWKPGVWTSNVDCDQFYSDEMIKKMILEVNNSKTKYGLLTGEENSFFSGFKEYTSEYEKRTYNNLPHMIYKNTNFMPTRATILESFEFINLNFKKDFYINKVKYLNLGSYNHYKFKFDKTRFEEGYNLGDRKSPNLKSFKFNKYLKEHPTIIKSFFTLSEK